MLTAFPEFNHAIIQSSQPAPHIEILVSQGQAKILRVGPTSDEQLSGFITPKLESDHAALIALADKLALHSEFAAAVEQLRSGDFGDVIFN